MCVCMCLCVYVYVCEEKLVTTIAVPRVKLPVRSVANTQSAGIDQGIQKCSCISSRTQKEFICFEKSKLLCNSKYAQTTLRQMKV